MARRETDEHIGEDSFLDTIANLVGIMIVLVVVIGSKTSTEAREQGQKMAAAVDTEKVLAEPLKVTRDLQAAVVQQAVQMQEHVLETEYRRAERNHLMQQVAVAKDQINTVLASTETQKRAAIEQQQRAEELESDLKKTYDRLGAVEEQKRPKVILEHLPTPMAKTVFGREMHLRLQNGLITIVPWDQLVLSLKEAVPMTARRNAAKEVIESSLGPVGGFMMRYRLLAVPGGFELEKFEIESTPQNTGETLEAAMSSTGTLRLELAGRNPAETVVTVWVYPDSFGVFRKLKAALFDEGFPCAARPLPEGMRIGASPQGSRSSAQ